MSCWESPYRYRRRLTREVAVGDPQNGGFIIGGDRPLVAQSMLTCDTMDTDACVRQTLDLAAVGCQLVRITAPTVKDAANLKEIVERLQAQGCFVPIVADIHFKPDAAMEAARWVEKIRVNPGNYADRKKFAVREYNDDQYAEELDRIEEQFTPLVKCCKELGRAIRIGTNHGSLSDRIMNRYGDTPMGMVESALEFARIARKHDYHALVFSMKSSNPKVMIECYRLLVHRLEELGPDWNYPIHLGVTEAGEGEDGRIKSAIGIGSLLADGIGDTLRVSLTEDSPQEIPVCHDLLTLVPQLTSATMEDPEVAISFDPYTYERRLSREVVLPNGELSAGGSQTIRVVMTQEMAEALKTKPAMGELRAEADYEALSPLEVDPREALVIEDPNRFVTVRHGLDLPAIAAFRLLAGRLKAADCRNPILLQDTLRKDGAGTSRDRVRLEASTVLGGLLADGIGDAIFIRGETNPWENLRLAYNILQAAGCRSFKTDYVACPSCGRTLFNLQTVTARIKARTEHLKGVRIAIMGCIVNGPGEMADADFGYVGGAPGKVNLYVGKQAVRFNIAEDEAVDSLVDLIKEFDKWVDPA